MQRAAFLRREGKEGPALAYISLLMNSCQKLFLKLHAFPSILQLLRGTWAERSGEAGLSRLRHQLAGGRWSPIRGSGRLGSQAAASAYRKSVRSQRKAAAWECAEGVEMLFTRTRSEASKSRNKPPSPLTR